MLGDSFGNWVSAGLGEVVRQQNGVVGEGVEFGNQKVPFHEHTSLIEEGSLHIPGILDRLG